MSDNNDNNNSAFDPDDAFNLDELITTAAVAAMPEDVRREVVQRIREQISVKAGDAAEVVLREARKEWASLNEFLKYASTRLAPELQGPTSATSAAAPVVIVDLRDLMLLLLGARGPSAEGYLEPTPNCGCPRCEIIRSKAEAGIRIRSSGEEEDTRVLN